MADRVNSLLADLKRLKVETGSLACLACGREHNCGVHGCAVLRETADVLQEYVDRCKRYAEETMELREKHQWIPVAERLPSKNGSYIVHCDDSCEPSDERIWGDSVVVEASWFFGAWSWNENGNEYDLDGIVTHWMPLPDAPRGKELSCRDDT